MLCTFTSVYPVWTLLFQYWQEMIPGLPESLEYMDSQVPFFEVR